ncbi:GMP reductase 1 isoform X1 [Mus musculus]|uniref:GMP reductase 1 isoform X1 n=1 Tax=Mus musculus TaxID=10090 RepID=UPI0003D6F965|nr:GMP reductase 1 isoform X1 [Mus musculus]
MPRIDADLKLDFKDVLLRPKRSSLKSRSEVDLERTFTFRNSKQTYSGIPIIVANMDTVGTFEMAVVMSQHAMFTAVHKHYSLDDWKCFAETHPECLQHPTIPASQQHPSITPPQHPASFYHPSIILASHHPSIIPASSQHPSKGKHVAVSSGSGQNDLERMSRILEAVPQVKFICLDVANGYSEHFVEFVKLVRSKFPEHTIMAGNVVTGEMVEELILSGADIIKVGVGPGSVCTTRTKTGVGYPQLSAVIECADSAHGLKGHIISDGGCTCPGDVAKAFGAGADFVMLGGMFSGHTECAGEVIERNGQKLKLFYGMSSDTAMKKHAGGVAEYRASEGKTVEVPYKGDVENTILDILGGLRSTCTYVGAAKLKELSRRATFIRVTQQHNTVFG